MTAHDLPLLDLFNRLREADFPLGIDDYHLLLRALQGGFGIADQDALVRLCRTLWVKSTDDAHLFDYHFEQFMTHVEANTIPAQDASLSEEDAKSAQPLQLRQPAASLSTTKVEPMLKVEDDIRVAQAISQALGNDELAYSKFIHTDEYLPVTRRQMKQSWRHLRRSVREGPPVELDVDATVRAIGQQGMLLEPVLVPHRVNRAELLLLIDQGGSMVPFHVLSRRLVETAVRGGRLGNTNTYYFHNCPFEYLYRDPAHNQPEPVKHIINRTHHEQGGILIFSDGGAARGDYDWERSALTGEFLKQCKQKFRYVAWLNPVPKKRWPGTTAGEIMRFVSMFDVSRRGLDSAIAVLCGRVPHLPQSSRYIL